MEDRPHPTTGKSREPKPRYRFIVDKHFQYSLIRLLLAVWLFNTVLISGILNYMYEGPLFRMDHLVNESNLEILPGTPPNYVAVVAFVAVFGLVLLTLVGAHMSNQIAGPLYRVRLSLERICQGDLNFEIHFRKRDYLKELAGQFNDMLRSLKERGAREVECLKAIEATLDEGTQARAMLRRLREEKENQLGRTGAGLPGILGNQKELDGSPRPDSIPALGSW